MRSLTSLQNNRHFGRLLTNQIHKNLEDSFRIVGYNNKRAAPFCFTNVIDFVAIKGFSLLEIQGAPVDKVERQNQAK